MTDETHERPAGDGPPPFGRSWRTLYTAVLINLAVLAALFYLFTRYFSG
ncbi:MAG TPA: hypothetical protein VN282_27595 [Pyrinomonadaceae bacterium]|nr:hypothetical protein [Pyrinomonadaceae bacterium]